MSNSALLLIRCYYRTFPNSFALLASSYNPYEYMPSSLEISMFKVIPPIFVFLHSCKCFLQINKCCSVYTITSSCCAGDKMIQIDDAGSGSLVGGTCIGILRKETEEYYYEILPVHLFNECNFKNKSYIYYTTKVVMNALDKLSVNKRERIHVCQGYMFEDTRRFLVRSNHSFTSIKIEDPLQSLMRKHLKIMQYPWLAKGFITHKVSLPFSQAAEMGICRL